MDERDLADKAAVVGPVATRFSASQENAVVIQAPQAREAADVLHQEAPVASIEQLSEAS